MNNNQKIFLDFWNDHHDDPNFYELWINHCNGDVSLAMEYDFFQTREEMDAYFIKIMNVINESSTDERPWHIEDDGNGNWSVVYDQSTK